LKEALVPACTSLRRTGTSGAVDPCHHPFRRRVLPKRTLGAHSGYVRDGSPADVPGRPGHVCFTLGSWNPAPYEYRL